ncbi:chemotaxis protein CheB [Luteibacter rhizovicinus]|nr:chemotaxis protein CheB [Luteibacter rhizovicinus]
MGCSAGGLTALQHVLAELDPDIPQPILVCCHTGSADVALLCELLARHSRLPVEEARERAPVRGGVVHVAPSGYHLLVEPTLRFALSVDDKVAYSRPSIDVMFESATDAFQGHLVAVLMTGANADGAEGLAYVRRHHGYAVVQDPASAEASAMPQAGLDIAGADACVPLNAIAGTLNRLCLP